MKERNEFKAGLFILISIAAIIALVIGIKGLGSLFQPHDTRTARFKLTDNVGGLQTGDEVRVGGLKLGVVRDIEFSNGPTPQEQFIKVRFTLPRRVELKEGASVTIESTVTGSANLNIDRLGAGAPLAADAVIEGKASGINALLADLPAITGDIRGTTVPKVNVAVDNANGLITDIRAKIDPGYKKYETVADRGSEALTNIRDIFGDTKADFRSTMKSVASTSGKIDAKIDPILDKFDGGLTKLQTSLDKVNNTLDDIKDISGNVRGVIANNRGRLDAIIASVKATADNMKGTIAELRRAPYRLLYKPAGVDQANQSLFDSARQFADGAGDLDDAATALRDALKNPQVDAPQVQKLIDELQRSFDKFNRVEKQLWESVKD